MAQPSINDNDTIEIAPIPTYETLTYWVVVPVTGYGEPRFLKREPDRLSPSEIALRLQILVPKRQKKFIQTIRIRMPEENAHVASIDIAVPEYEERPTD